MYDINKVDRGVELFVLDFLQNSKKVERDMLLNGYE